MGLDRITGKSMSTAGAERNRVRCGNGQDRTIVWRLRPMPPSAGRMEEFGRAHGDILGRMKLSVGAPERQMGKSCTVQTVVQSNDLQTVPNSGVIE